MFASGKDAISLCDICGFKYPYRELRNNSYGLRVCPTDWDGNYDLKNHPQNGPFPTWPDPQALRYARPDVSLSVGVPYFPYDWNFLGGIPTSATLTRNSIGMFTDGNIEYTSAAVNVARLQYDSILMSAQGVLNEAAATNLFTYSDILSNAVWTKTNVTFPGLTTLGPDGSYSTMTQVNNTHVSSVIYRDTTVVANTSQYIFSVVIKKGNSSNFSMRLTGTNGTVQQETITFNFDTLIVGGTTGNSGYIALPNSCYLVWGLFVNNGTNSNLRIEYYLGSGVIGYWFHYNSQLELGTYPSSQMIAAATTVSRSADIISLDVVTATYNIFITRFGQPTQNLTSVAVTPPYVVPNSPIALRTVIMKAIPPQ